MAKNVKFEKEEREFLKENGFKKVEGCEEYVGNGKIVAKFSDRTYTIADTKTSKFLVVKKLNEVLQ